MKSCYYNINEREQHHHEGGHKMKLGKIRKGYYTDGQKLYCGNGSSRPIVMCECREESENFIATGNEWASIRTFQGWEDVEVRPAKVGETFCNGEVKVIEKNVIEYTCVMPLNPEFNENGTYKNWNGYKRWIATQRA